MRVFAGNDVLTFGRHKGKKLSWVAENYPSYICWMVSEEVADIPQDLYEKALEDDANNSPPEEWYWDSGGTYKD